MLPLCGPPCHPERGGAGATEDGGGTDAVPTDAKARPAWMRGAGGAGGSSLAKVPYHELALAPAHRRLSVRSHVPFAAMRRPRGMVPERKFSESSSASRLPSSDSSGGMEPESPASPISSLRSWASCEIHGGSVPESLVSERSRSWSSLSLEREGGTVPENELSSSSSVFSLPSRETESIIVPDMRVLSTHSSVMVLPISLGRVPEMSKGVLREPPM
mmetsp:Transcript_14630/g.48487  ORF Transcript_14630/g.48487 Transcript_14630/m.48487 type:complete len:217 (+) Transcript_14630:328-978(+)